jgi:hypothetical protein
MSGMFGSNSTSTGTGGAQNAGAGVSRLLQTGNSLTSAASPLTSAGTDYYRRLLTSPQAAQAAVAPTAANINQSYEGAREATKATQFGVGRDVNLGQLQRGQQDSIARLYAGVQPAAANAVTSAGQTMTGQGIGAFTGAVGGGTGLASQQSQQQLGGGYLGLGTGQALGQGLTDLLPLVSKFKVGA